MGRSNEILFPFYRQYISPIGKTALLGFVDNDLFKGDCYDLKLKNWDINSDWQFPQKYDTIICTRCAYFAKDLFSFFTRCYNTLSAGGVFYVDWGLGDHWRFPNYKLGWVKDGEQEYAYNENNFLWSSVWHDDFLENNQFKVFCKRVKKFGYNDVKKSIAEEVPCLLNLESIKDKFIVKYNMIALWDDFPQLYTLLKCIKK